MRRVRRFVAYLMILSLAFALVACGKDSGLDGNEGEVDGTPVEEQPIDQGGDESLPDEAEPTSPNLRIACVEGTYEADVEAVRAAWDCEAYASTDALAAAIIEGKVDLAVVPVDVSAALFNASGGSLMALDVVCEDEAPRTVSVVTLSLFGNDPESAVAYIARHQQLVAASSEGLQLVTGSAMQRVLSDAIADAYVNDPTSVGGELPPDNFYFLG